MQTESERSPNDELFGINQCQIGGIVIDMVEAGESTLLYVRYGCRRKRTKQPTQFVNVVIIRVPNVRAELLAGVEVGSVVSITGRMTSFDDVIGDRFETITEIVAQKIRINTEMFGEDDDDDEPEGGVERPLSVVES